MDLVNDKDKRNKCHSNRIQDPCDLMVAISKSHGMPVGA